MKLSGYVQKSLGPVYCDKIATGKNTCKKHGWLG